MKRFDPCSDYLNLPALQRRNFLKVGLLGGLGLSLSSLLQQQSHGDWNAKAKAKSVILFWLQGGITHHETFDPKPDAPENIRGELSPISTSLPGVQIGELLPKTAAMMNDMTVIRSVTHSEAAHERGSMYMVEGRKPTPGANGSKASGHPQLGSIVAYELAMRNGLPPFVSIPGNDFTSRFTGSGFLPASCAPFKGMNSSSLKPSDQLSDERFAQRLALRTALTQQHAIKSLGETAAWSDIDHQAVEVITSGKGSRAFHYDEEPDSIKQLYGMQHKRSDKGRYALIARRLVEAGVRFVTIGRNSWDHHSNLFPQVRSRVPSFDYAWTGLITDLKQRGMLDETLVIYMTEYGRTPKINDQAGRDHWPNAFSIAFAGAGIQVGQVIGASDHHGASVIDHPVSPEEIAATILHLVGIPPQREIVKPDGRPGMYVDYAKPIEALLS